MAEESPGQAKAGIEKPSRTGLSARNRIWFVVSVVTVSVIVVAASQWPPPTPPAIWHETEGLTVEVSPASTSAPAGTAVNLTAIVRWGQTEISYGDLTIKWTLSSSGLGSLTSDDEEETKFIVSSVIGNVSVSCMATYVLGSDVHRYVASAFIRIVPATLEYVVVAPPERYVPPGTVQNFTAAAYDSLDILMANVTLSWTVSNTSPIQYWLNSTIGHDVSFIPMTEGTFGLNVMATTAYSTAYGDAVVLAYPPPSRKLDYTWHDMFNVPNGEWWDRRYAVTSMDEPITDSYPYLYKWYGSQEGRTKIYSSMMLNITGRNMYEISTGADPLFLPMLGNWRGGIAEVDWYMQYLTHNETLRYPGYISSQDDGWMAVLNGTVTLDRDAALTVMGISSADFDYFDEWWTENNESFKGAYADWLNQEAKVNHDIYVMYEYPFTLLYFDLDAERTSEGVVLSYDMVTWGMEALMAVWLSDAFMPCEWWYEGFSLSATIGPQSADLDIETAVEYAVEAYATTLEGAPCWRWMPLDLDQPPYDFSRWWVPFNPGSELYGLPIPYDFRPAAWNLSENETLSFVWPAGEQMFLTAGGSFHNTTQSYADMEVRYAEPMWGDMPSGQFIVDNTTNTLTYTGPFDMWTWSRDQSDHAYLADQWDLIGLLPYGIPMVELSAVV